MGRNRKKPEKVSTIELEYLQNDHADLLDYVSNLSDENSELLQEIRVLKEENQRLKVENVKLAADLSALKVDRTGEQLKPVQLSFSAESLPSKPARMAHQIQATLSSHEKMVLFRSLFRGREDVFAKRWESKGKGTSGYSPACAIEWHPELCGKVHRKKCTNCQYIPISNDVIEAHLSGRITVGVYPMLSDESCWFLAVDFDKENWKMDASAFLKTCNKIGVYAYLERSRSGNGGHIWVFFNESLSASLARKMGAAILTMTMEERHEISFSSYDRFFPNQDTMPKGGFGNLIALPLQGKSLQFGNTIFIDSSFVPYPDQWAFLASIRKVSKEKVSEIVEKAERDGTIIGVRMSSDDEDKEDPWTRPPSQKREDRPIPGPLPSVIKGTLANLLFIDKSDLSSPLINRLKRIAAFQNPEFYRAQAMRMPTYDKPRVIACADDFPRHVGLPRGSITDVLQLCSAHNINLQIDDQRFRGLTKPTQLYLSRENSLVRFSLTENETSNHTVVLADSGSGKSSFVIDAVQAAKRMTPEPLIFVIDKKSSYLMLSKYFDADLTVFDRREEDMPFSPFRGIYDEEKVAFLTNLILAGVRLTSSSFAIEGDHTSMLGSAINMAYKKATAAIGLTYVDGELVKNPSAEEDITLSMDDVVAELSRLSSIPEWEKSEEKIQLFIQQLRPFFGEGHYARFFRAKKTLRSEKKSSLFYIYDLDALDSETTLQALMTMAVVEEIRQTIKLSENQNRGGFIVIEELGMIGGDNPWAARFIKDAAETFRKLGYFLIGLTPRPQNFFEMEAGRAMWGVADNFIFLQMSPDNVKYLKDKSDLIDEASSEIIKSLRTVRGEFADVFYVNKKKTSSGAFKFFQTPFDRWLAPTNAKSLHEAKAVLEKFPDEKWKALSYLAEKYPKGIS